MIINTALLSPRNIIVIAILALVALMVAKRLLPHPATGGEIAAAEADAPANFF
jgi:hypothetical protein